MPETINPGPKLKRGFAAMAPEKQRELASRGGRASHGGGRPRRVLQEPHATSNTVTGGRS